MRTPWIPVLAQTILLALVSCSVIPKPSYTVLHSTTQISSLEPRGTGGEGTIIVVTSSELPKQIPPPPTPTRPHRATPRYDHDWPTRDPAAETHTLNAFRIPLAAVERADIMRNVL